MKNKDFIAKLSQRTGLNATDTQNMVFQLIDAMVERYQEGDSVSIQNFGTFEVKKKQERIIVNPSTGKRMLVPPKLVLGFKISPTWKYKLKAEGAE